MSLLLALASVLVSSAQACAMPHEALVVADAAQVATPPASLADVFAEIDRVDADNGAKAAIKKALETVTGVGAATIPEATIPEATVPATPPTARPTT